MPEIVLAGRSNVGKSSFINTMCGRKKLAYVGNTPGKTRLLNFFNLDAFGGLGAENSKKNMRTDGTEAGRTGKWREEPGSGGKNRKWREEPEVARRTGIKEAIKNEDSR